MKLSVVIPTYNRKDSLRRTLDGLARQTYPAAEFEAVVVSDGSTDGTDAMLAEYARRPTPCAPSRSPTAAPPSPATGASARRRNEVIVFLDDDVEPVPEFLARHAAHHADDEQDRRPRPHVPRPGKLAETNPSGSPGNTPSLQQTYDLFRPGGQYERRAGPMHFYSGNASVRPPLAGGRSAGFDETFKRQEDVETGGPPGPRLRRPFRASTSPPTACTAPSRTFESWLRIPHAYGALDAQRVRAGQMTAAEVWDDGPPAQPRHPRPDRPLPGRARPAPRRHRRQSDTGRRPAPREADRAGPGRPERPLQRLLYARLHSGRRPRADAD